VFKATFNSELSTRLIQKNSLPSAVHESQFSGKQKFHSTPNKDVQSVLKSEQLTVYTVITKKSLICLMIYILKQRAQHLLVRNNAPPPIRKPPHNRRLSPIWQHHVKHIALRETGRRLRSDIILCMLIYLTLPSEMRELQLTASLLH